MSLRIRLERRELLKTLLPQRLLGIPHHAGEQQRLFPLGFELPALPELPLAVLPLAELEAVGCGVGGRHDTLPRAVRRHLQEMAEALLPRDVEAVDHVVGEGVVVRHGGREDRERAAAGEGLDHSRAALLRTSRPQRTERGRASGWTAARQAHRMSSPFLES